MGLYLCIFDKYDNDICGIDVGRYQYFAAFRQQVAIFVDQKRLPPMPTLLQHLDCDGEWNTRECKLLINELQVIKNLFQQEPPSQTIYQLKENIFKSVGIVPHDLFECFIAANGEFLIDRLLNLSYRAIKEDRPIIFQ